ncbi:hypothetical protein P152DRAFT_473265 [Eremomyces bilateralis CBS 781.70]|uniref:Myb-like domain-containing protein n=1 Tax=Eremomyces bilateralis CBS 781.70 TaxID=1392243 RepID=A0A6G1G6U3_9PEZI|nr:uncharacterized protein P152DRAFT_473265 [Eremomyces bilateralis CBS 781.70]KAF1813549.1 hypothetical protein P152DRAFT_473265 [Eremomyces bilateralis CBS 781.70]
MAAQATSVLYVHESVKIPTSRRGPSQKGKERVDAVPLETRATRHARNQPQPLPEASSSANKRSHDELMGEDDGSPGVEDEGEAEDAAPQPKKRRGRKRTAPKEPDVDSELVTIVPNMVAMSDLCRDLPQGQVSEREKAMRKIDWAEVKRRRRELDLAAGQPHDEAAERAIRRPAAGESGMETRIVNGEMIIVNNDTVQAVNRHADAEMEEQALEAVEEDDLTNFVNRSSWINQNRRDPADRVSYKGNRKWTGEQTDEFYEALRMVGTDFLMLSQMLPGRTRREVKSKFVREERIEPDRVRACLISHSIPFSFDEYREKTGQEEVEFVDPAEVQREIDEERARMLALADKDRSRTVGIVRRKGVDGAEGEGGPVDEGGMEPPRRGRKAEGKKKKGKGKVEDVEILGLIDD